MVASAPRTTGIARRGGGGALALTLLLAHLAPAHAQPPAPTAGDAVETGVLRFMLVDAEGRPIPGRLTFVPPDGSTPDLFPNAEAAPDDLAGRKNVIYTLRGSGAVTVPVGAYTVHASRGLEWSIASEEISFAPGEVVAWEPELRHEVDTTGWVSGDFHLHTLTYSGHGDSNLPERIISIVGEGVEFAVATDHNHHTDYGPTVDQLGAHAHLTHVTGNEVSVPVGHFNAFPLEPDRAPPPSSARDANALFRMLRDEPNRFDLIPVIQLNHPRWDGIDYFAQAGLDPVTGDSVASSWSEDFDSVEVFNENEGWGYHDAEIDHVEPGSSWHSVLEDWFNLLNRGHRAAAVGNSDSHTVHYDMAGYPRNFVASPRTDDPGAIDVQDVAAAVRAGRVFTTIGPFVEWSAGGVGMGDQVMATGGEVELWIRVQAASWVDCDRVKVVVNGDVVKEIPVPDVREPVRLETTVAVGGLEHDAWICLLVEGDDSLAPIVGEQRRAILPLAVTNPIRIDGDGDGCWTSLRDRTRVHAMRHADLDEVRLAEARPRSQGLLALAAAEQRRPFAAPLIAETIDHQDRRARLLALRAAEILGDEELRTPLEAAWAREDRDAYERAAQLRALAACGGVAPLQPRLLAAYERDPRTLTRHGAELEDLLPGRPARDWLVAGYFDGEDGTTLTDEPYGPESAFRHDAEFTGRDGTTARWIRRTAAGDGRLDGREIGDDELATDAIWYGRTWLHAPDDRRVLLAFGTDDGARLWVGDALIHEDTGSHGAAPLQSLATVDLPAGWTPVLFKVRNGGGATGLYLRALDDEVKAAVPPDDAR